MATDIAAAAEALLHARRENSRIDALPEGARPTTVEEVYAIQKRVAEARGPIGGWKVGAADPQAEPGTAPLNVVDLHLTPEPLPASRFHVTGVEAEIAYLLGRDLPPRETPYTREEVLDAVESLHPVIEIVDTRFTRLKGTDLLSHAADQINHGALVVGPALADWRGIDPVNQPVRLLLNGQRVVEQVGGNPAGDPVRLLQWLANTGARAYGGLSAGMIVTTGSCTGLIMVEPGTRIMAEFPGLGAVETAVA
ncbi:2-keto-4-pentenoate hydratase [Roseomonas marmotae]|uniref:Fumarylacetoacetate hydrolase family protein n=1 Tax=Roseomonas marmotae TaxID=2768161 RepID=A0ABS3KFK2_9PROT|nr:fumarylacetoacetate hydrolase family protein [Roseomonas marmotae]MBO1076219.1 fumarylacetoacetate hydrolase family protein [Roseomonas marmotae]QTI81993.1 fumarylacetoacetate hydrolase family protein [Roseomonas marmotae]